MRTDIIKTYKDIHSWVGIIAGLALFIAFYAGAITMFEGPLQRWASPPTTLSAPPSLEHTPVLIEKALAAYPEAAKSYTIHLETSPEQPARMSWSTGTRRDPGITYFASLAPDGSLEVSTQQPSPVAEFVDVIHQQIGLPLDHEIAMPIMGAISLLYVIAIISGIICLLPSLVKDLFALRLGKNLKRMWLDLHNVLGLFSIPFHLIMALSAVVFAFHDQFYDVQGAVHQVGKAEVSGPPEAGPKNSGPILPPTELAKRVEAQMPGFTLQSINYENNPKEGPHGRIRGVDPRYGLRGANFAVGEIDTVTGDILQNDYLPGRQDGWFATVSSFFALHFGNYGGAPVRWSYFFLGLAGAFIFYSGNLLWIESRRKKERKAGRVTQSRSTQILGALTVGVTLGCIAGLSITIAAAKWLPADLTDIAAWHSRLYYATFLACIGWAMLRGAARSGSELLGFAAVATALIPITSIASQAFNGWSHSDATMLVDVTAALGAFAFAILAKAAHKRALQGPKDSIWAVARPEPEVIAV